MKIGDFLRSFPYVPVLQLYRIDKELHRAHKCATFTMCVHVKSQKNAHSDFGIENTENWSKRGNVMTVFVNAILH